MTTKEREIIGIYETILLKLADELNKKSPNEEKLNDYNSKLNTLTPYIKVLLPILKVDNLELVQLENEVLADVLHGLLDR